VKISCKILPNGDLKIYCNFEDEEEENEICGCLIEDFNNVETHFYDLIHSNCGVRFVEPWELEKLGFLTNATLFTNLYYDGEEIPNVNKWKNNLWIHRGYVDWVDSLIKQGKVQFEVIQIKRFNSLIKL